MTDTNTGWKLVPLVPTPEMMEQYQHAFVSAERFDGAKVYRAMVDAAPSGPKYSEDVLRDFIAIEKRLCEILGRPWAPVGFSIETLCAEIKARLNSLVAALDRCITDGVYSRGVGATNRIQDIDKIACDALRAAGVDPGKPKSQRAAAKPADPDPSGLIALLETDVQWHVRRGNNTIATDLDRAIAELKRLYRNSGEVETPEVEDLISSTWFANRPAVLDAIRAAGMRLTNWVGRGWALEPLPESRPTQAALDVLDERKRQVEVEGWSEKHDDGHGENSMSIAAACYALAGQRALEVQTVKIEHLWQWTGWSSRWFKPKDKRSNLVRAGALVLAEIERLDRAAKKDTP